MFTDKVKYSTERLDATKGFMWTNTLKEKGNALKTDNTF